MPCSTAIAWLFQTERTCRSVTPESAAVPPPPPRGRAAAQPAPHRPLQRGRVPPYINNVPGALKTPPCAGDVPHHPRVLARGTARSAPRSRRGGWGSYGRGFPLPVQPMRGSSRAEPGRAGARRGFPSARRGEAARTCPGRRGGLRQTPPSGTPHREASAGAAPPQAGNRPPPGEPPATTPAVPPLPSPLRPASPRRTSPRGFPASGLPRPLPPPRGGGLRKPPRSPRRGGCALAWGGCRRGRARAWRRPPAWGAALGLPAALRPLVAQCVIGFGGPGTSRGSLVSAGPASGPMPAQAVPLCGLIQVFVVLLCNLECQDEAGKREDFYIKRWGNKLLMGVYRVLEAESISVLLDRA